MTCLRYASMLVHTPNGRSPVCILPNRVEVSAERMGQRYYGTRHIDPDEAFKNGIPVKGSDRAFWNICWMAPTVPSGARLCSRTSILPWGKVPRTGQEQVDGSTTSGP